MIYVDFRGQKVSRLGIGCSNFGKRFGADEADEVVKSALDHGINFFDVADVYGGGTAEELLARGLGQRRKDVIVATKFGHGTHEDGGPHSRGGHPLNVIRSADASLKALKTDYIDLYQMHEPDPNVPVEDTLEALSTLIQLGKVRWAGCSNFSLTQLSAASGWATVQNEYSVLVRDAERDVLPYCRTQRLGFIPYFPLASGVLTGKYRKDARIPAGTRVAKMKPDKLFRFFTPRALDIVESLADLGTKSGNSILELALGLHVAEPAMLSVITGAMSGTQVAANAAAIQAAAELPQDVLDALREL